MSATLNKLGDEFAHPADGRPVRVVRMDREIWAATPQECDHCCVLQECTNSPGLGRTPHGCGMGEADFVAYVDDIPLLTLRGYLA